MEHPIRSKCALKSILFAIFSIFSNFLEGPRPPKIDPKSKKSAKKRLKFDVKKIMFFNTVFSRFFVFLTSENGAKIDTFSLLFRKRRFRENPLKHWLCAQESRFGPSRNDKNHQKNASKKAFEKSMAKSFPKIDFGFHFGLPNPPKIDPTSKKIEKNRVQKKAPKKQAWTLPDLTAN